jgi:hypothetical protein
MSELATRLEGAVHVLVGDGPVKHRLALAYSRFLADLEDPQVPAPLRPALQELRAALHRVAPVGKEGWVKASIQKMSIAEASGYAASIAKLHALVSTPYGERAEPLKVVTSASDRPPRYLIANSN